jgi:hypothetical protein
LVLLTFDPIIHHVFVLDLIPTLASLASVAGILGTPVAVASYLERSVKVLRWRLHSELFTTKFQNSPNSSFSDLRDLEVRGEVPFPRPRLEQDIICQTQISCASKEGLIVGGAGGLGKSVFWEKLLSKRPLKPSGESNPWSGS